MYFFFFFTIFCLIFSASRVVEAYDLIVQDNVNLRILNLNRLRTLNTYGSNDTTFITVNDHFQLDDVLLCGKHNTAKRTEREKSECVMRERTSHTQMHTHLVDIVFDIDRFQRQREFESYRRQFAKSFVHIIGAHLW